MLQSMPKHLYAVYYQLSINQEKNDAFELNVNQTEGKFTLSLTIKPDQSDMLTLFEVNTKPYTLIFELYEKEPMILVSFDTLSKVESDKLLSNVFD